MQIARQEVLARIPESVPALATFPAVRCGRKRCLSFARLQMQAATSTWKAHQDRTVIKNSKWRNLWCLWYEMFNALRNLQFRATTTVSSWNYRLILERKFLNNLNVKTIIQDRKAIPETIRASRRLLLSIFERYLTKNKNATIVNPIDANFIEWSIPAYCDGFVVILASRFS